MSIISFNFTLSAIEILYKVLIVKLTLPVSIRDICVCIYLLLCGYPACSVEIPLKKSSMEMPKYLHKIDNDVNEILDLPISILQILILV